MRRAVIVMLTALTCGGPAAVGADNDWPPKLTSADGVLVTIHSAGLLKVPQSVADMRDTAGVAPFADGLRPEHMRPNGFGLCAFAAIQIPESER